MNVRFYGSGPYRIAVVHGGPGAVGSVSGLARGIAEKCGVIEPLQSKFSIDESVEELRRQIEECCIAPVILIGHSWGAWLAAIAAAKYPGLVGKIILIGCGPLTEKYAAQISVRRQKNMSDEDYLEFNKLISCLGDENTSDKNEIIARLDMLVEKTDYYDEIAQDTEDADTLPADGEMYAKIWPEAAQLRKSGQLLELFKSIKCPIVLMQGEIDPHPYQGVFVPLSECGIDIQTYILEKCGHTPWKEKYAIDKFYQILFDEIR